MSASVPEERFTRAEHTAMMRAERAVKDKSYRRHWLGQEVGRFLRAKRIESCSENTLLSYETTLARFTRDHEDVTTLEVFVGPEGADMIVEFLAHNWGDAAPATLDNRVGCLRSFFEWARETGRIPQVPRIRRRRVGGQPIRVAHELAEIRFIVSGQEEIEDEVALLLMGRLAFRKDDVRLFQKRDVDLAHDRVFIRKGKGTEPVELPIAFPELRDVLALWLSSAGSPEQYLWHPRGRPNQAPNPSTVHRRFKRCLALAGVHDFQMHELRHSAGDRLWRQTGDLFAANRLLRHKSLDTTRLYLHPTQEDLRARLLASDAPEEPE